MYRPTSLVRPGN